MSNLPEVLSTVFYVDFVCMSPRSVTDCVNFTHWGPFINPSRPLYSPDGLPLSTRVSDGKTRFVPSNDDSFNSVSCLSVN